MVRYFKAKERGKKANRMFSVGGFVGREKMIQLCKYLIKRDRHLTLSKIPVAAIIFVLFFSTRVFPAFCFQSHISHFKCPNYTYSHLPQREFSLNLIS